MERQGWILHTSGSTERSATGQIIPLCYVRWWVWGTADRSALPFSWASSSALILEHPEKEANQTPQSYVRKQPVLISPWYPSESLICLGRILFICCWWRNGYLTAYGTEKSRSDFQVSFAISLSHTCFPLTWLLSVHRHSGNSPNIWRYGECQLLPLYQTWQPVPSDTPAG